MADRFAVLDMPQALNARSFPTVTLWNRVEGRPRTVNFERALRAEVRDALWMISRQWQIGEFTGEDAGSPVSAKVHLETTRLTRFRPGDAAPQPFDPNVPLEAHVESQPVAFSIGSTQVALDLRLMMGRRWLKLIAGIGDYSAAFIDKYRFAIPNPRGGGGCSLRRCRVVGKRRRGCQAHDGRRRLVRVPDRCNRTPRLRRHRRAGRP